MQLSTFKHLLKTVSEVNFSLPNGKTVPSHFHITEVGHINKRFIDCGGTIRQEKLVTMQLWESVDTWHKIEPNKLLSIIDLSIEKLLIEDDEIEVEYQNDTIGKYGIDFEHGIFKLVPKQTNCLAQEKCGIPVIENSIQNKQSCCTPNSPCC